MKISIPSKSIQRIVTAFILGAAVLAFGGGKAYAQSHDRWQEKADFKQHQRYERQEFGGWAMRGHQRAERRAFKQEESLERQYGAYGHSPYGAYQYPSGHVNGYSTGHTGYDYPSGYGGSYYSGPYHGNGWHSPGDGPHHHHDHHY
jgi:hypothetical protein